MSSRVPFCYTSNEILSFSLAKLHMMPHFTEIFIWLPHQRRLLRHVHWYIRAFAPSMSSFCYTFIELLTLLFCWRPVLRHVHRNINTRTSQYVNLATRPTTYSHLHNISIPNKLILLHVQRNIDIYVPLEAHFATRALKFWQLWFPRGPFCYTSHEILTFFEILQWERKIFKKAKEL